MTRFIILLTSLALILSACQEGAKTDAEKETTETTASADKAPLKYTLTPFTPSPSYPDATIENVEMKDGAFSFTLNESSYKLGAQTEDAPRKNCANSDKGQHIHVLINDNPYAARYTAQFSDLKVPDGDHYMLAFLSRSYHESIKTDKAHTAMKMSVKDKSIQKAEPVADPMVWYSRPKGNYKGKANTDKVMLDFYLLNTNISATGNKVKAEINDEVHLLDKWQPYYVEGLPMGKNKITLSLLDKDGNLVKTAQNPISREFTLQEDIAEKTE
ncbi:MAG: phosphopeptide-binding protein [Bacteroidota bacterium]